MRNKAGRILLIGLVCAAVIVFCLLILWLVDQVFNGAFKDWFYSIFYVSPEYADRSRIGIIFKSWPEIKQFFVYVFFMFIIAVGLCIFIAAALYQRYRAKKDISMIADAMNSYIHLNRDELTLPEMFSQIEAQLVKTKAASQKQQQLMQAEMQRKNDLITYLAHDLKTPLASVIGYLSILDEARDMPAEQKVKYVGIALEKAYRLEELINEFFEITRFNLQSVVLNKGRIKLAFMLLQLADEFYPLLKQRGNQIVVHIPEDFILVGDADKLARVFNNIVKNAIAYSYTDSVIDISAVQQGDRAVITFANQGDLIPPMKLDTIFEKFFRLDSARSTNTGGAGLGLAIAKEIVEAHGGTIAAESNESHTKFTVILPS